jgi:lipoprotein-anchoring transpeptidase ErfK/SrfK
MVFRTTGALATLLIGLAGPGDLASAQHYPPSQAYPPPPHVYPPPPPPGYRSYRPPPSTVVAEDDAPLYDPPMVESRPLPPVGIGPQVQEPAPLPPPVVRRAPGQIEEAELPPPPPAGYIYRDPPPPPGYIYRDPPPPPGYRAGPQPGYGEVPPGYREGPPPPGYRDTAPGYATAPAVPLESRGVPPQAPQGFEPPAAGTRPYYGPVGAGMPGAAAPEQDAMRPPLPIGPGQVDPSATGTMRGDPRTHMAALPPEVRPETGPRRELPLQFQRTLVDYRTKEPAGTIIIDTQNTYLYLVIGNGKAMRYGVGVGREGFTWTGSEKVTKMAEWPDWNPPAEMIERQPYLPRFMAGGEGNPLGARALYLGKTIYRIHGTNQPSTIGTFVSSGCIRLTNEDVMDLYNRVKVGTRVVVLPGKPPATVSAGPYGQPGYGQPAYGQPAYGQPAYGQPVAVPPGAPPVSMAPPGPPPTTIAR